MPASKRKSTPKQPERAKRVQPLAGDSGADCQEQFNVQIGLRTTVPKSPKYTASPNIATTFDAWTTSTDKAQTVYKDIIATEKNLKQMYTSLSGLMLQYRVDRDTFLVTVSGVCDSDEDAKSFGLQTKSVGRRRIDAGVPGDVHAIFSDVGGDFTVRWSRVDGAGAYVAEQCSADPEHEASWAQCYMGSAPSFKMTGLTVGQKLWFRVRSIGKKPSAWSAPIALIVR
jgi:hypothetical protein